MKEKKKAVEIRPKFWFDYTCVIFLCIICFKFFFWCCSLLCFLLVRFSTYQAPLLLLLKFCFLLYWPMCEVPLAYLTSGRSMHKSGVIQDMWNRICCWWLCLIHENSSWIPFYENKLGVVVRTHQYFSALGGWSKADHKFELVWVAWWFSKILSQNKRRQAM